ncbi:MAG: alpha/beta fold hydrolase [Chloroflexi bacterium]|nr:alpha/beta fold hydrolase [Chloroflexota bacterium]
MPGTRPEWLSDESYPFEGQSFATSDGQELHYVDEGSGPAVVFVHGNPTWSFEFRHLIAGLRSEFRCIAADHVGFGLSSRSTRREDHHPRAHAKRLTELLEHLDVRDTTLFLTDWGGPIGLEFARRHPERVAKLVITNTWCWPVSRDPHYLFFSLMMRSPLGQLLIKRFNAFVNRVMPMAIGNKAVITPEMMDHYRNAQPEGSRNACAALPGHIIGATSWLGEIWEEREAFADKPALIFWGFKDIAFRRKELERWKAELSDFTLHEFEECGHFLAEEAPERILPELRAFLARA